MNHAAWAGLALLAFGLALSLWKILRSPTAAPTHGDVAQEPAPPHVQLRDGTACEVATHLHWPHGLPLLSWQPGSHPPQDEDEDEPAAPAALCRAWLLHLRDSLGPAYRLVESDEAMVLSTLEDSQARALSRYVSTTRRRMQRVLQDIAAFPPELKSIVLVMEDEDTYYRYVSGHYPEDGEFAFSGGMFLSGACPHFVVKRGDLREIEPVIAHELAHSALAHLQLPLWLDEGLAVNTEQRLAGVSARLHTAEEIHAKHLAFWNADRIQDFWSGRSFSRPDDGQMLSYELASVLVREASRNWDSFARFAREADSDDAGHAASLQHLGIDLGASVQALFAPRDQASWAPDPARWRTLASS